MPPFRKPSLTFWATLSPSVKRFVPATLKLLISLSLFIYFSLHVDVNATLAIIVRCPPGDLLVAVALLSCSFIMGGLRWRCVLISLGQATPLILLIRLFWIGGLASQVLPNPFGDAVRISYAVKHGIGIGQAVRSTVLERIVMILSLLTIGCLTVPLLRQFVDFPISPQLAWGLLTVVIVGVTGGAMVHWFVPTSMRRFRVVAEATKLSSDLMRFLTSRWSIPVYLLATLGNLNLVMAAVVLGQALALPITPSGYFAVIPVATIAMVVPVTVGGWGVREGVLIALLGAMGVLPTAALAFSVLIGLCLLASSLPAVLFLWGRRHVPSPTRIRGL